MKLIFTLVSLFLLVTSCSHPVTTYRLPAAIYKTDEVVTPPNVRSLLDFEQKFLNRKVDESKIYAPSIEGQKNEYRPEEGNWFTVKSVWLPEDQVYSSVSSNSEFRNNEFIKTVNGKKYYLLFIHPESESFYVDIMKTYEHGDDFLASSTSSSRTVMMTDGRGKFFFGKLSLNVELGGVVRTIPRGEVARSVGTSEIMGKLDLEKSNFKFLPESYGVIPKGMDRGGMILREFPEDAYHDGKKLVPLFSLYARPDGVGQTIIEKMLQGVDNPVKYVEDNILAPFTDGWIDFAVEKEIVMEAHAQNVLIQLDKNNFPTGQFYHRDLGGFNVNLESYDKSKIKSFIDMTDEFHQAHHASALKESLEIYFEGGFVFNLNEELKRIYPKLSKSINLKKSFEIMLAKKLKARYPTLKLPGNIMSNIDRTIQSARSGSKAGSCRLPLLKWFNFAR